MPRTVRTFYPPKKKKKPKKPKNNNKNKNLIFGWKKKKTYGNYIGIGIGITKNTK